MARLFSHLCIDAPRGLLSLAIGTIWLVLSTPSAQAWPRQDKAAIVRATDADDEPAPPPHERAALGVTLGEATGGVEITGIMPNSPAAEAGLRPGDVVLAIDGEPVSRSGDVIGLIAACQPEQQIRIMVDRKGLRGTLRATLASQVDVTRRAALGVTLSKSSHGGVRILQVVSGSPADKGGLKVGDRILAIDGQAVANYGDVIGLIGQSQPGSDMKIDVDRYGLEGRLYAQLTGRPQVFSVARPRPPIRFESSPTLEFTPAEINDQRGYGG